MKKAIRSRDLKRVLPDKIFVPDKVVEPHHLVQKTAKCLAASKPDRKGILEIKEYCLDIRVSSECADRALRIIDALIKGLQAKGFEISVSEGATLVSVEDVSLRISLQEETKKRRVKAIEHDLEGYYRFGYQLYTEVSFPTGVLSLIIDDSGFPYGTLPRKAWRDSERKRLEECLGNFIHGLMTAARIKHELEKQQSER